MVIIFSFIYSFGLVVVNTILDWQIFNIYNVCLLGDEAPEHEAGLQIVVFQIPVVLMIIGTVALDIRSYLKINAVQPVSSISKETVLTSFHVSVTSTILIAPYLLYMVVVNSAFEGLTPQKIYLAVMIPTTIINLFRNPIILILTSKYAKAQQPSCMRPEKKVNLSVITLTTVL